MLNTHRGQQSTPHLADWFACVPSAGLCWQDKLLLRTPICNCACEVVNSPEPGSWPMIYKCPFHRKFHAELTLTICCSCSQDLDGEGSQLSFYSRVLPTLTLTICCVYSQYPDGEWSQISLYSRLLSNLTLTIAVHVPKIQMENDHKYRCNLVNSRI